MPLSIPYAYSLFFLLFLRGLFVRFIRHCILDRKDLQQLQIPRLQDQYLFTILNIKHISSILVLGMMLSEVTTSTCHHMLSHPAIIIMPSDCLITTKV